MTSSANKPDNHAEKRKPFPWLCSECGQTSVVPTATSYTAEVKHDGRLYSIEMPQLEIPTCASCGARVFSNDVDDEISRALRSHLRLLAPEQILAAIKELGMSQKGVAECLGIAEATLSRWVNGLLIQSRAMDNLLRAYFASSRVREMLLGTKQDPDLGTRLSYDSVKHETADRDEPDLRRLGLRNAEAIFPEVERVYGLDAVNEYGRSVARRGQLLPVGR